MLSLKSSSKAFVNLKVIILFLPVALFASILPALTNSSSPNVVYVDPALTPGGDGASWATAYGDLETALSNSPEGSEFWCAQGDLGEVEVNQACEIYGGFNGYERLREGRDWTANKSMIRSLRVTADVVLDGFTFVFNPKEGEVVFVKSNNAGLRNCKFEHCISGLEAIYFEDCLSPFLVNCYVVGCKSGKETLSPVIAFQGCQDVLIVGSTIADNRLSDQSTPVLEFEDSTGDLFNTILWNPGISEIGTDRVSDIAVYNSNVRGGYVGETNIDKDPGFSSDYHIRADSPCRDAGIWDGTLAVDWDGDARPYGEGYDIGADECIDPYMAFTPDPVLASDLEATTTSVKTATLPRGKQPESPTPTPITPTPSPTPSRSPSPIPTSTIPIIDEGFNDYHNGVRPIGWTFVNCSDNSDTYVTSANSGRGIPSICLDATGDQIVTKTLSQCNELSFWLKGQSTDTTSALLVEEYHSTNWTEVTNIAELPTSGVTVGPFGLNYESIRVRFTYAKSVGNLAFDDVQISRLITPTPSVTPPPSPTASVTPSATPPPTTTPTLTPIPTATPPPTVTPSPSSTPTCATSPTPTPTALPPIIDEGFDDYHIGVRPSGWTFVNCDQDSDTYTSEDNYGRALPSLKLDATGDCIITESFAAPNDLSFWVKGQLVDENSSLLVEEYYSATWYEVTNIADLPTTGTTVGPFILNIITTRVQFTYSKSQGNLAFDDVLIGPLTTPTPVPTPSTTPTVVPTTTPSPSPSATPTPTATPTSTPTVTPSPPTGYRDVVINEVNFAADITNPVEPELGFEYVELYNRGTGTITLADWRLRDSSAALYIFPAGAESIVMPSGSYLLIFSSSAQGSPDITEDTDLSDGVGTLIADSTWVSSDLVNTGDAVQLYSGPVEDSVTIADFIYYDEINEGNGSVDAKAVAAGIWASQSAIDTLGGQASVGRAIYLLQDGQSSHEAVGDDEEDLDWGQYPEYYGGSPGFANPLPATATPTITPVPTASPIPSATPSPQSTAFPLDVVINEIGWMGTEAADGDEYIELYNNTDQTIQLSGWTLKAIDGTPDITLTGAIPESTYFLLERTDDTSVGGITADLIYTGALENTGEVLELRDGTGQLIDSVGIYEGGWYSGEGSPTFYSMERIDQAIEGNYEWNWRSNDGCLTNGTDADGNPLNASPKSLNSVFFPGPPGNLNLSAGDGLVVLNWSAADAGRYDLGGYNIYRRTDGGSYGTPLDSVGSTELTYTDYTVVNGTKYFYIVKSEDDQANESTCSSNEETVSPGPPPPLGDNIIISEILFNPVGDESLYEWIELYNPTSLDVVLDLWWITDGDGRYTFPDGENLTLAAGDYLVMGASSYAAGGNVDVVYNNQSTTYGSITLNNTEDEISLYNAQSELVDVVHYYENWIRDEGHSIVRKAVMKDSNFVELQNIGDHAVDLVGLKIFDGAECDSLQPYCTDESLLQPSGYGLIINNQFYNNYSIAAGTVLVTCGDLAIGNGLTPLDDLILYDRDGATIVSSFTSFYGVETPPDNTSIERIDPEGADEDTNWGVCQDPSGSTPGSQNSITP